MLRRREPRKRLRIERRFDNSAVGDASWPCVLVLVNEWIDDAHFAGAGGKHEPYEMVPKTLFMPDGRSVPVCVVKVTPVESIPSPIPSWHWPGSLLGGGVPINVRRAGTAEDSHGWLSGFGWPHHIRTYEPTCLRSGRHADLRPCSKPPDCHWTQQCTATDSADLQRSVSRPANAQHLCESRDRSHRVGECE